MTPSPSAHVNGTELNSFIAIIIIQVSGPTTIRGESMLGLMSAHLPLPSLTEDCRLQCHPRAETYGKIQPKMRTVPDRGYLLEQLLPVVAGFAAVARVRMVRMWM